MDKKELVNEEMRTQGTQIALCRYDQLPQAPEHKPVCSWPLTEMAGRMLLHQVLHGMGKTLWDLTEKEPVEIKVEHIAAKYGEYENPRKPGEVISGPIIHLIGPGGPWHTGSQWVWESLRDLIALEGPPPWYPPFILRASRMPTRNKNDMMSLVLVGRMEP